MILTKNVDRLSGYNFADKILIAHTQSTKRNVRNNVNYSVTTVQYFVTNKFLDCNLKLTKE